MVNTEEKISIRSVLQMALNLTHFYPFREIPFILLEFAYIFHQFSDVFLLGARKLIYEKKALNIKIQMLIAGEKTDKKLIDFQPAAMSQFMYTPDS